MKKIIYTVFIFSLFSAQAGAASKLTHKTAQGAPTEDCNNAPIERAAASNPNPDCAKQADSGSTVALSCDTSAKSLDKIPDRDRAQ